MQKVGKETIAIIVVTYNRQKLLEECIKALLNQKHQDIQIFIIDNASTDKTKEYINNINNKKITYCRLSENIGGAGGFNYGLKKAYTEGYKYFWLMDDDCIVQENSLTELLSADKILRGNYGFLSSIVLWKDKKQCIMNRQKISTNWWTDSVLLKEGLIRTNYATFVGFFTTRETLSKVGLPIKEFFIWGDDIEYSNRISKINNCYVVGKSQVVHKTSANIGSNIAKEQDRTRLSRYKYAYRNEIVIAKNNGVKGRCKQIAKIGYHIGQIITSSNKNKILKIHIVLISSLRGIFFRPTKERL